MGFFSLPLPPNNTPPPGKGDNGGGFLQFTPSPQHHSPSWEGDKGDGFLQFAPSPQQHTPSWEGDKGGGGQRGWVHSVCPFPPNNTPPPGRGTKGVGS